MGSKKTIEQWEKEKGWVVVDPDTLIPQDGSAKMTEEEFDAIPLAEKRGVHHEARIEFLKINGYEVTRENLINSELSDVVTPEPAGALEQVLKQVEQMQGDDLEQVHDEPVDMPPKS